MRSHSLSGQGSLVLDGAAPPEVQRLVDALLEVGRGTVSGILVFGSQLVQASPDRHSAVDLVVLVDSYKAFHQVLVEAGHHRRSRAVLSALARVLPPNVIAFFPSGPDGPVAKCMILTEADFAKALGPNARDHFLKGRMVQRVALLHARDQAVMVMAEQAVGAARNDVFRWLGPYLEGPFTAREFASRMIEVSYRGEIRPESGDRVRHVFDAQSEFLEKTFQGVLERAEAEGRVVRAGDGWSLAHRPGVGRVAAVRLYFLLSKARATSRWLKHIATFNDWLTYIQRKVERRTGIKVEITPLERRFPLVFLWPKVFRILRARPAESPTGPSTSDASSTPDASGTPNASSTPGTSGARSGPSAGEV